VLFLWVLWMMMIMMVSLWWWLLLWKRESSSYYHSHWYWSVYYVRLINGRVTIHNSRSNIPRIGTRTRRIPVRTFLSLYSVLVYFVDSDRLRVVPPVRIQRRSIDFSYGCCFCCCFLVTALCLDCSYYSPLVLRGVWVSRWIFDKQDIGNNLYYQYCCCCCYCSSLGNRIDKRYDHRVLSQ